MSSLADEAIKSTDILKSKNTEPLEEALDRTVPEGDADKSKWFCSILENKEADYATVQDYFDCWVLKASILTNIEFLKEVKMQLYTIAKEHKRLDEKIQNLMLKSNVNLKKLF